MGFFESWREWGLATAWFNWKTERFYRFAQKHGVTGLRLTRGKK